MREKYLEERFGLYFEFGVHPSGNVDVATTRDHTDVVCGVSPEEAATLIADRHVLLSFAFEVFNALEAVDPVRATELWGGGGNPRHKPN